MKKTVFVLMVIYLTVKPAFSQDAPDPSEVYLKDVQYFGNGCLENTVVTDISDDREALTILFNDYVVEKLPQDPPGKERKSCSFKISLNTPPGWSFALFHLIFRGYANLDNKSVGIQNAEYSFGQNSNRVKLGRLKIDGAYMDDYERIDDLPLSAVNWSPCTNGDHVLRLDTMIAINSKPDGRGLMTVDSLDGEMSQQYGLIWKKCNVQMPPNGKWFAFCKMSVEDKITKKIIRQIMTRAKGANKNIVTIKASGKMPARCSRLEAIKPNLRCLANTLSCNAAAL